jgi:hypothetical protein
VQQHGYFHAGVTEAIADSACGYAAYGLMPVTSSVGGWLTLGLEGFWGFSLEFAGAVLRAFLRVGLFSFA